MVFCCSVLLFALSWDKSRFFPLPAHCLGVAATSIPWLCPTMGSLFHTEAGALQGFGLSLVPSLAQRRGLGTDLLVKALFFMCLLAFLV